MTKQFLEKQVNDFKADHTWEETFWMLDCKVLNAAGVWVESYEKRPKETIESIKNSSSPACILEEAYHILVNRKALVAIKDNDEEFRKELINLTTELFGNTEQKVFYRYTKALYLFSSVPVEIKKTW